MPRYSLAARRAARERESMASGRSNQHPGRWFSGAGRSRAAAGAGLAVMLALLAGGAAVAQEYPSRPITIASIAVNETYYKAKNYTAGDLRAIAIPAGAPETLAVNPNDSAKTLAEI